MSSSLLEQFLQTAVRYVWNPGLLLVFLLFGLYLTIGTRFFQFRRFGTIWRNTMGGIFRKRRATGPGILTSFQAWAAAAGSAIGMGNIAGVASAVAYGGPGALLWMWMAALVMMATKMGEVTLAVHFREQLSDGKTYGGPTYYMQKGLGHLYHWPSWIWKGLAGIFIAGFLVMMFIGMASYTIQETFQATFNTTPWQTIIFGMLYTAMVYAVILGGIKRVGKVAEYMLPAMALMYILGGLVIIFADISQIGKAFLLIFKYAFTSQAAIGGIGGFTVMRAIQQGVAKGVYSNEAGWGTSPMLHATAKVDHPVRQGMWGAFEVFLDTVVICTITGLVVIITGIWEGSGGGGGDFALAFESVFGDFGKYFVFLAMFAFVFTTSTGWYSYYETLLIHLFKNKSHKTILKAVKTLQIILPLPTFLLAVGGILMGVVPKYFWLLGDLSSGLSVYANLITLILLSPLIFKLVKEFEKKYLNGKTKKQEKDPLSQR